MDRNRPVQHCAEHRKQLQITRSRVADGDPHGEKFSGNRENLSAGEEILRRSPVGQQPRP